LDTLADGLIRDTKNALLESSLPVNVDKSGNGTLALDFEVLNQLPTSNYSIFLRFNDYLKINIRKPTQSKTTYYYKNREFTFYDTIYSNIGLKISSIK
jgi:hypothetical protein